MFCYRPTQSEQNQYPMTGEVYGAERLETELEAHGAQLLGVRRRYYVVASHESVYVVPVRRGERIESAGALHPVTRHNFAQRL